MSTSRLSTLSLKNGLPKSNNIWDGTTGFFESIATVSVDTSAPADVNFTSIPSGYTHLQLRLNIRSGATYTEIIFNDDTAGNYTYHQVEANGSTTSAAAGANQNQIYALQIGASTTHPGVAIIDILDYKNTDKFKTVKIFSGVDTNGGGNIYYRSGLWRSTSAISSLKIKAVSSTYSQYSHIALYGIRSF